MSQEFAWQFYVGLAAVAIELRGSSQLSPTPETAGHDAVENLTDTTSDLARWDDDGGAPCSPQSVPPSAPTKARQPRQWRTVSAKSPISKGFAR